MVFKQTFIRVLLFTNSGFLLLLYPYQVYSDESVFNSLLMASGLTKQLVTIPDILYSTVTSDSALTDQCKNTIRDTIYNTIHTTSITDEIIVQLERLMTQDEILYLKKWYDSETGKLIAARENSTQDNQISTSLAPENQLLINTIESTIFAAKVSAKLQAILEYAVYLFQMKATDHILLSDQIITEEFINQLERNIHPYILSAYSSTYGAVETERLSAYLEFLQHPSTRKFYQTTIETIYEKLDVSINQLSKRLPVSCH